MSAAVPGADGNCGQCRQPLSSNVVCFRKLYYHSNCFVCVHCKEPMTVVKEHDGKFYCETDFNRMYGKSCGRCKQLIEGNSLEVNGRFYHREHFTCIQCNTPITSSGNFVFVGDDPVCTACDGLVCDSCGETIFAKYSQVRVPGDGGKETILTFHPHCYVCVKCKAPLSGKILYHNGHVHCGNCKPDDLMPAKKNFKTPTTRGPVAQQAAPDYSLKRTTPAAAAASAPAPAAPVFAPPPPAPPVFEAASEASEPAFEEPLFEDPFKSGGGMSNPAFEEAGAEEGFVVPPAAPPPPPAPPAPLAPGGDAASVEADLDALLGQVMSL